MNKTKQYILFCLAIWLLPMPAVWAQQALKLSHPKMFVRLDSTCMTPDAMAIDGAGNIYLSVTNATTFDRFGARIVKLSPQGEVLNTWATLPKHPVSGKVHPMGMAFGTDGYLYIADNQSFAGLKHASRVLRARLQNGAIQQVETVVSGLNVANGLRFHQGYVYITDAWTDNARKSGVFRFSIAAMAKQPIVLDVKNRADYRVHEMELDAEIGNGVGTDGMDFDADGNLYVGNFSNGTLSKIMLGSGAQQHRVERLMKDRQLIGCDGIFFDKPSNSLIIANFLENSVLQYSLSHRTVTTLWKNKDAACTAELDCPCDLVVLGNTLIVVNFDTYTTNANQTIDNCNTVSVFEIRR
jgi:sugar lactone lactonase YvrE